MLLLVGNKKHAYCRQQVRKGKHAFPYEKKHAYSGGMMTNDEEEKHASALEAQAEAEELEAIKKREIIQACQLCSEEVRADGYWVWYGDHELRLYCKRCAKPGEEKNGAE